jgi:hypothetical protein
MENTIIVPALFDEKILDREYRKEHEIIDSDEDEKDKDFSGIEYETVKYPYDPIRVALDIRDEKMSIYQLMRKIKDGNIDTSPEYQRNFVWKKENMSRFIESILLDFPIPPLYLNQSISGKYVIIDGRQRTTTLHRFLNNEFALKGLTALKDLEGKSFNTLDSAYQAKLEDKNLLLYIVKPSVPIEVVYELFDRINTGGMPLNRQEVRNCILKGQATKLLAELADSEIFKTAVDNGVAPTRMKDQEMILRFLASQIFDYATEYPSNLSDWVENAMRKINKMTEEEIVILKQKFTKAMQYSFEFFGNRNFRYPQERKRGFVNTPMLETIAYFFATTDDNFLGTHKAKILENYEILLKNEEYYKAIRFSTGGKNAFITRFNIAKEILGTI